MSLRVSITAKINRMAIAPIYTTTWTTARKDALNKAKVTATPKSVDTSQNAAWTRLRVVTTMKPEPSVKRATTRKMICSPVIRYLISSLQSPPKETKDWRLFLVMHLNNSLHLFHPLTFLTAVGASDFQRNPA